MRLEPPITLTTPTGMTYVMNMVYTYMMRLTLSRMEWDMIQNKLWATIPLG